jgi:hypothetical protein
MLLQFGNKLIQKHLFCGCCVDVDVDVVPEMD